MPFFDPFLDSVQVVHKLPEFVVVKIQVKTLKHGLLESETLDRRRAKIFEHSPRDNAIFGEVAIFRMNEQTALETFWLRWVHRNERGHLCFETNIVALPAVRWTFPGVPKPRLSLRELP